MPNGHACCVLEVCCRKREDAVTALAEIIQQNWSAVEKDTIIAPGRKAALIVMEHFDLVPKGLARAIVDAYEPHFAAKARKSE